MIDNWEQSLSLVLKNEGGFSNDPRDPGGATNFGVTKKVWEMWVGHSVSVNDIRNLTIDEISPLYKQEYWDKVKGDDLPYGVDYVVFDLCVNSGVSRAIKILQDCLSVTVDGQIGPVTLAAVKDANPRTLCMDICEKRLAFLQSLPTWSTFGAGWNARVVRVEKTAFNMA
jgi:lysozyme family protein